MSQIASHDGTVIAVAPHLVKVEMHVVSACSSCKAHASCTFVDKADKVVEVETDEWKNYNEGDTVTVTVNESLGLLAVLLAYILPALLLIAAVILLSVFTHSELVAAALPIAIVAVYYLILYRFRNRLQKKFSFGLTKGDD